MLLTKVILENYGVFRDRKIFDFSCTEEKPIVLFGGTNGSGKTTLFESIMLCLYGNSFFEKKISRKEYEKFLARKIHRYLGTPVSAESTSITVDFEFYHQGKVDLYSVTRTWSNDDGKVIEQLEVKKNDALLDSVEQSQWQFFIEELIPRGIAKLFFFDGEKITKMAEEGTEDAEIKSSFDTLLGLDFVEQLQSDLRIHLLRIMGGKEKEVQEKLDGIISEKNDSLEKIGRYQEKLASLRGEIDNKTKEIDSLEGKIAKLGGGYASKREELKARKAFLEMNLSSVEENIRSLCSGLLPFSVIPKQLDQLEDQLKDDQEVLKKQFEKDILEKNFDSIKSDISKTKFWSDFIVDHTIKEKIISKLGDIFTEKLDLENSSQNGVINFSTVETNQILSLMDKIRNELPKQLETQTVEFSKITDELKRIETALINAPNDDEIGPLVTKLNSYHEEIGALKKEFEYIEQNISKENSLLKMVNFRIKGLVDEKYKEKKTFKQAEMAEKVQKILAEYSIKLKIKKLQLLESYLLESITNLMHKENFIEKVSVNKETFEITLYRKNEDEIHKDLLSKGEKQMLATAVLWALAKTSGKPLPFIIDTPLARLDLEHRENLIEKFFPIASHQVAIFSTNSEIDEKYYPKIKQYV